MGFEPMRHLNDLLVFETNPFSLLGIPSQPLHYTESFHICVVFYHTIPCAIIASATFMKPAILAPKTRSPR